MARFAGRPMDKIWFIFFTCHIPTTLLLDIQVLYPPQLLAKTPLPSFFSWYLKWSRDPILGGAVQVSSQWDWLRTFIWLEALFQLPCFIVGAIGLWKNDRRVYPLLLAYGASTATTLVPVLHALLNDTQTPPLTPLELTTLLLSYVPFLLIPLFIALDMGHRLINATSSTEKKNI